MASLPIDLTALTAVPVELIEDAARRQMSSAAAELEAYRLAVARVRKYCEAAGSDNLPAWVRASLVLDLLAELPGGDR